jgi:uncharacterized low-complexity protein
MKNDSTILKKSGLLTGVLFTGAILTFPAIGSEASDIYNYSNLGSGSELRSELLDLNNSSSDLATRAISFEKYVEGKCGEGKCGEGKCGEKKDSKESKKDTATTSKTSEGKCGEGKCGEKKDSKKTETKSEKK